MYIHTVQMLSCTCTVPCLYTRVNMHVKCEFQCVCVRGYVLNDKLYSHISYQTLYNHMSVFLSHFQTILCLFLPFLPSFPPSLPFSYLFSDVVVCETFDCVENPDNCFYGYQNCPSDQLFCEVHTHTHTHAHAHTHTHTHTMVIYM